MDILLIAVGFVLGLIVSFICKSLTKNDGTLKIDQTNPSKDTYSIEIDNLDILPSKKKIVLKVKNVHDNTHF